MFYDSKVLDVVSVADIDAQERVDGSLVDILKLRYGQGFFWLKFGQHFEAKIRSKF